MSVSGSHRYDELFPEAIRVLTAVTVLGSDTVIPSTLAAVLAVDETEIRAAVDEPRQAGWTSPGGAGDQVSRAEALAELCAVMFAADRRSEAEIYLERANELLNAPDAGTPPAATLARLAEHVVGPWGTRSGLGAASPKISGPVARRRPRGRAPRPCVTTV